MGTELLRKKEEMNTPKHILTIKRSEWLRVHLDKNLNKDQPASRLLNYRGIDNKAMRCCMGFDCSQIHKINDIKLYEKMFPSYFDINHLISFKISYRNLDGILEYGNLESFLAMANDRSFRFTNTSFEWVNTVSDEEQENIITRLYSLVDYEVIFVD